MSNYTFRQLDETNLHELYKLHKSVYGKKVTNKYYHLKYATAYTGVEFIGFFAFLNNTPVAYYGVIPTFVSLNNKKILGAQSCDTMTHLEHRKQGLFITLANKTFGLAKEKGIHFVFGFPNQHSYPGFVNKLGFSHSETLERYTLVFKDTFYKKILRKFVSVKTFKREEEFSNNLINSGFDGILYDSDYINYKKYNRSRIFQTENYSAWIHFSKIAWLGALSDFSQKNIEDLVVSAKNKFHCESLTFMISPGVSLPDSFNEIKKEEGFAVITKNLSGKYDLSNLKFQFADIDIF